MTLKRQKYLLQVLLPVFFNLVVSFFAGAQSGNLLPPGFPDRSPDLDVLPGFKSPPKGYGEVSFYWWIGDTLTRDRLLWQLDQLKGKGITGLQINYCHTDRGGASYGLTYPSQPALFSAEWWKLFEWFLKEAKKREMSVSLSDYTLGAAGQGWFVDEMLKENPGIHGSRLEARQFDVPGSTEFKSPVPGEIITASAYKFGDNGFDSGTAVDLLPRIKRQELYWQVPPGKWKIILVYKTTLKNSFDPMNPVSGKKVVEKFYQRFEDHCPGESGKGLNFFFSDELQFGIRGYLWNNHFADEFRKRKGYNLYPELPHLFADLGPRSFKIRLDYNDVMVSLSETGFFKPVYEWHNSRGMLFGCDHGGRGRDVTEFGDYFRTQRWMSGPGCDQPGLGKDIVKNKVASSIAHLYERPRTWLEGFYGSGWGTSSEEIADATFANFAMGQNLLSLHGLYYTTHGSWWEWAAPDNHWRQPYWKHMDGFLKCSERLSYILSQGHHRCDVAIIYPVAPTEANLKGKESTETAFSLARDLYSNNIDFDFMDFESLDRSLIQNRELNISGEKYKVLVLPALSAVRYSTIEKALAFFHGGGIVMAAGALPEASERVGANDEKLQGMIREIFGTTFSEKHDTTLVYTSKSKEGGSGIYIPDPLKAKNLIDNMIQPDFKVLSGNKASGVLHRKIGQRDVYFVYGVSKETPCSFRASGKVELWNPWNGSTQPLKVLSANGNTTTLRLPLEKNEPQLVVFSAGKAEPESPLAPSVHHSDTLMLQNNWDFELKPTLDNKFGDYRIPAFDGKLGIEIWEMQFAESVQTPANGINQLPADNKWRTITVSYGPQFLKLGPLPSGADLPDIEAKLAGLTKIDPDQSFELQGKQYFWQPYEFSWRWGLKGDAGHQGYHGLKGVVNNEIFSAGILDNSHKHMPEYTLKPEKEGDIYYLWSTVAMDTSKVVRIIQSGFYPKDVYINNVHCNPAANEVTLKKGSNPFLLKYAGTGRGYFVLKDTAGMQAVKKQVPLSTVWYLDPGILPFDCFPSAVRPVGWYRFKLPPGARRIFVTSKSMPEINLAGTKLICRKGKLEPGRISDSNLTTWEIDLPSNIRDSEVVTLKMEQSSGYYGGAAIPEPIVVECGKGTIRAGDLAKHESLKTYSGGMFYGKSFTIGTDQANSGKITLDLGKVVASAEVMINGKSAGIRVSPPWTYDFTGKLLPGENKIEILVYNTLGNHYLTTPSQYIGRTESGLIGPVRIMFE